MEPDEQDERIRLAAQIADGQAVDWPAVEPVASARTHQDLRFLQSLQAVAAIAKAHAASPMDGAALAASRAGGRGGPAGDPIQWGPLRIIEKIGRGSFGDVYRAYDPRLDRDVALKLIRRSQAPDESEIVEEARLMARVHHPNVVTIYGAERIDGHAGIWMKLLSHRNLAEEVAANGPMPPQDALRTVGELARALSAIHGAGLLHRDVKPQNVLRDERGLAVLTDFGTGHQHEEGGLTSPIAGTPLYLAPEILDRHPPSVRADLYSLGVVLYYLLSAGHPVEGRSIEEIRDAHRTGRRTPLRSRGSFSRRLRRLVDRATDPDPSARPATAAELEADVAALQQPSSYRGLAAAAALGLLVSLGAYSAWRAPVVGQHESRALVRAGFADVSRLRMGSVSPDGQKVVCSGPGQPLSLCGLNDRSITVVPLASSSGVPDGAFAQFSPDGRRIVYTRINPDNTRVPASLHIANVDGTGDRQLFAPQPQHWFLRPTDWASQANVIVGDLMNLDGAHAIVLIDPNQGTTRVVRSFDREHPVQTVAISADARYIAHDYQPGRDWTRDLVVIDATSGDSWTLVDGDSDEVAPIWARDGSRVFFSSDRSGTMGIWEQPVSGGRPVGEPEMLIETGRDLYTANGTASDGRILYLRRTGGFDGYRTTLDLSGAAMNVRRVSPRALDEISAPDWSPDGSRLAYLASSARIGNRIRASRVVIQDTISGREFDWIVDGQIHQISLRWWPDGKSILLRRPGEPTSKPVVEQRDVETGRVIREFPLVRVGGDVMPTPDGAALIYTASGAVRELRLADLRDRVLAAVAQPWALNGPAGISMTSDGDRIAVSVITLKSNPPEAAAMVVTRSTGAVTHLRFPVAAYPVAWVAGGRQLLAVTRNPESERRARLFTYDPVDGSTRNLGLTAEQPRQFRVHPGGKELLFSAGQSRAELWWLTAAR